MRVEFHPSDPKITLLIPDDDEADPELSLVVPAMNEQITIEEFVAWCHEGLARAGVRGEILIVDSSSDRTPELAVAAGARVLRTPKRGLGRAYIDSVPVIRGKWIIMGDADCTYDFRNLTPFVEEFKKGTEYVMGSRWRGSIEPGAMPALHQYFGTPFTTWILNRLYGSTFSDIHCGMRGMTKDALVRINLSSQSWEYASELVLKSVHLQLPTAEVPVTFLKDKEGRVSHHRRMGWFSPFQAAWINLKAMFIYGADFFLVKPGVAALAFGLMLLVALALGPVTLGGITFSIYWMLLGLTSAIVGLHSFFLGLLARSIYDFTGIYTPGLLERFRYTRAAGLSMALMGIGPVLALPFLTAYIDDGFGFEGDVADLGHLAVLGLFMI
ncbi:MAG: glycosyltransferase family 2 protein [Actinomycetota bacterium]|nr:glycosyltransferase family 2 protein [Actinomycetota bacterium]